MLQSVMYSVPRKLMLVVLSTTFMALLVFAATMMIYDIRTYKQTSVDDLITQADILARSSAPALAFNDPKAARDTLALLKVRPRILAAAIYAANGNLFATYANAQEANDHFPKIPERDGYRVEHDQLIVFHHILENREVVGTIYLRARYEILARLQNYVLILAVVMALSLVVAALIATWLQAAITKPILAVADVALKVMQHRDFSLRVRKTTEDEIGILVDAFNAMLNEVGRRADAIEKSNATLQHEMKERRSAEEALLVADRRKDEFLATLAHELRNPLAPLRNGLAILRISGNDTATSQKAREIMERQINQMVRLVDDLLDVSRITTGKLAIKKEPVELHAIVNDAIETVTSLIESRRHELVIDLPDAQVFLDGDATRLAQVILNLLNNAAKYTNPGGRLSLRAAVDQNDIVIRIADNGIGISGNMLPVIFDMFTQADYSLERSHAGLGVGLSLSKRLVELHGGTIEAYSAGLNRGSEFVVRLPVAMRGAEAVEARVVPEQKKSEEKYRILLADDNVDFASSMATMLRTLGHDVKVTNDGVEALEVAAAFHPDFAFLDIGLPKLNGYDLARALRDLPATASCVLSAVTGWGQEKDRQRARLAGFHHHLVKPVEFEQLLTILSTPVGTQPVS